MKRALLVALIVVVVLVAGGAFATRWAVNYVNGPLAVAQSVEVSVAAGSSLTQVAAQLADRGIIRHPKIWVAYARLHGLAGRIHAGEYSIAPGMSAAGLLDQMVKGNVILRQITIVEGWNIRDVRQAFASNPYLVHTLDTLDDASLMAKLGSPGVHPEGRFFPDTYRFAAGTPDLEILQQAHDEMTRRLAAAWADHSPQLPVDTADKALVLASIVEKESSLASERPRIAGVFAHRLRLGMRLQSDPTVIYGLGTRYDGNIRSRDLHTDTPYNTYTRAGLPPTPIAMPSAGALIAATQPDDSGALYFVATGEPDGSHYFSSTLDEHTEAVRRYLARMRSGGAHAANP